MLTLCQALSEEPLHCGETQCFCCCLVCFVLFCISFLFNIQNGILSETSVENAQFIIVTMSAWSGESHTGKKKHSFYIWESEERPLSAAGSPSPTSNAFSHSLLFNKYLLSISYLWNSILSMITGIDTSLILRTLSSDVWGGILLMEWFWYPEA